MVKKQREYEKKGRVFQENLEKAREKAQINLENKRKIRRIIVFSIIGFIVLWTILSQLYYQGRNKIQYNSQISYELNVLLQEVVRNPAVLPTAIKNIMVNHFGQFGSVLIMILLACLVIFIIRKLIKKKKSL